MKKLLSYFKIFFVYPVLLILSLFFIALSLTHLYIYPSNDRNWTTDQAILPYAEINNNLVTIHNIRDFSYKTTLDYVPNYFDSIFDLNKIKRVWYVVEPFAGIPGSAHTFLSFEFEHNQFVAISVEIRKEKGETYNPIKGLFNQYELMYVIAYEKDVIKLRTNYRKDQVFLYPAKTTPEKARELFLDMIQRANILKDHPEFYNTVTNTCTTNIVRHVDKITPHKIPLFNLRILLPANSDKLAYDLDLIDTSLYFDEARKHFYINDKALKYADDLNFSAKIRGN